MTLIQLEYLIAIDTHRNYASAAKHLFVTQPTLSMQVKKIEDDLGVMIFDRSRKPVLTTDIEREIIHQARIAVTEVYKIKELVTDQIGAFHGELRLGIIPTLSPYILPLLLPSFMKKYPDIELQVDELQSEQLINKIKYDLVDVGLLVTPIHEASLTETPLFYERFMLYLSAGHKNLSKAKIDYKDIDINEVWLLKEGNCFRNQVINICNQADHSHKPRLKFESGSLETIKRIIDVRDGSTVMPQLATLNFTLEEQKRLRDFPMPQPVREISLVTKRSKLKSRLIKLLQSEILAHLPKEVMDNNPENIISWTQ